MTQYSEKELPFIMEWHDLKRILPRGEKKCRDEVKRMQKKYQTPMINRFHVVDDYHLTEEQFRELYFKHEKPRVLPNKQ
ncbi:MAG TPA: hypothetical protein DIT07_05000 [Sphingobacteriaceae bacterium]|nr:hypothetical protein [Sphingobacteriaceae bacterium]